MPPVANLLGPGHKGLNTCGLVRHEPGELVIALELHEELEDLPHRAPIKGIHEVHVLLGEVCELADRVGQPVLGQLVQPSIAVISAVSSLGALVMDAAGLQNCCHMHHQVTRFILPLFADDFLEAFPDEYPPCVCQMA
eukprot:4306821-Heterocapsa_arctica.AAC.1